jgi:hypothetical protein
VLGAVKARPGNAGGALRAECRPALTPPARGGCKIWRSGWKNARGAGRTKEWDLEEDEEAARVRSARQLRLRPCYRMSQRIIPAHSVGPLDSVQVGSLS